MTFFIRRCILLFLIFEVIVFFVIYCFGPRSLKTMYDIEKNKLETIASIKQIQQEISELEQQIKLYSTPFAKEKLAREKLLMKQEAETVYFIES